MKIKLLNNNSLVTIVEYVDVISCIKLYFKVIFLDIIYVDKTGFSFETFLCLCEWEK